jgi:Coenzyme PQQ synthesis protein D (PqqD)
MQEILFSDIASEHLPDIVVQRAQDQISRDLGSEGVILNLKNKMYYGLNGVGTRIWDLISEPRRVGEVLDIILEEYDVESGRCESDLVELLQNLSAEGLIQVTLPSS